MKKRLNIFLIFLLSFLLIGCSAPRNAAETTEDSKDFADNTESIADSDESSADAAESITDSEENSGKDAKREESTIDDGESPPAEPPKTTHSESTGNADIAESATDEPAPDESPTPETAVPDEDGSYTSKEDVACYIYLYGHLPPNFITKKEAEKLGWPGGSLEPYAPGMCIGGSRFGNYEGLLPEKEGRTYTECDIDTLGADKRGAKRIVFSNDGLIYYTEDHYETFELLYGDDSDG